MSIEISDPKGAVFVCCWIEDVILREEVRSLFTNHPSYHVRYADSLEQAKAMIHHHKVPVIMCEKAGHNSQWIDLLAYSKTEHHPSHMVVLDRHADEAFFAEVLNRGGWDVLRPPFVDAREKSEFVRTVREAWFRWAHHQQ